MLLVQLLFGNVLIWPYGAPNDISRGVRPLIFLNSKLKIDTSDTTRDGSTAEKAWKLVKK